MTRAHSELRLLAPINAGLHGAKIQRVGRSNVGLNCWRALRPRTRCRLDAAAEQRRHCSHCQCPCERQERYSTPQNPRLLGSAHGQFLLCWSQNMTASVGHKIPGAEHGTSFLGCQVPRAIGISSLKADNTNGRSAQSETSDRMPNKLRHQPSCHVRLAPSAVNTRPGNGR
jgi:hypothetical protein